MLTKCILGINKYNEIACLDMKHGFSKMAHRPDEFQKQLKLHPSAVSFCANEIDIDYDYSSWKKINGKTDLLSCNLSDEFVWYKAKIPADIKELTLSARHLFAIYINGKEVLSRNSYKLENLQEVPETIQVPLNKSLLNKVNNELTILVENLGFDKGFSDDTNCPRGLVTFETTPSIPVNFYIQEKLTPQRTKNSPESISPYLLKISTIFDIDFDINHSFAKYLYLKEFPYRRATIFLNGYKIGRYIKRTHVQDKFYLISSFLKEHNTIDIIVWQREKHIQTIWDFKCEAKNVILEIGDEYHYQLFK